MRLGSGTPLTLWLIKPRCVIDKNTGCWNYTGDKAQRYPRINFAGTMMKVSHASLMIKLGRRVTSGMCAMHSCDNTRCANPNHLSEGTHLDNRVDAMQKGRFSGWKLSDITKSKMSVARTGSKLSDAAKAKLSDYWRARREAS